MSFQRVPMLHARQCVKKLSPDKLFCRMVTVSQKRESQEHFGPDGWLQFGPLSICLP